MRVLRLTALALVAVAIGAAGCSRTVEGNGTLAADLGTATPTSSPSGGGTETPDPTPSETETTSETPSPTPSPTTNPITTKRRLLCVLERASITSINSNFNKAKNRDAQITVLNSGAGQITGHLARSGLAPSDRIYAFGKAVLSQLNNLIRLARAGQTPSTTPYNQATTNFQKACSSV
jgi:hypothetical protein